MILKGVQAPAHNSVDVEVLHVPGKAVVGDPALGEVVGADALGPVAAAHLAAALGGDGGVLLLLLRLWKPG